MFSLLLGLNYYYFDFNVYGQIGLVFCLNILNAVAVFVLFCVNKKLRFITIESKIHLSQRYQVNENIKALYIFFPLIVAGIIGSVLSLAIQTWQSLTNYPQSLRTSGYSFIISCFPTVCFAIIFIKDPITRNRILHYCRKRKSTTDNAVVSVQPPDTAKNVIGKDLVIKNSPENHFAQLTSMWK